MINPRTVASRIYVPAVSLCLVLLFAHFLRGKAAFDPLVAAQNERIRFQAGGETSASATDLTPTELALAESVLKRHRVPDGEHTELLYIGNSQTIAVMDPLPGDLVSPQWLQIMLARQDGSPTRNAVGGRPIDVNLGSLANITTPELLVQLVAAGERSAREADILVCSAVLEEFRGLGIRDEVAALTAEPTVKARLHLLVQQNGDLETVHTSLEPVLNSSASSESTVTTEAANFSYAQKLERRLQKSSERIPLFAARDDLRGQIYLAYHEWRNRLLGITSASLRPVPESSYRASLEMIELALRYAQSAKVRVVVYLAPIRPLQPNPNLPSDVAKFRRDMPTLCQRYGAKCLDYVDLVPEKLWTNYPDDAVGTKGQRDYAHFTGAAHKLLAEKLMTDVGEYLRSATPEGSLARP
jgi:hypothetical protein